MREQAAKLKELLCDSLAHCLHALGPDVAVFLSGGLDSSLMLALANEVVGRPLPAITVAASLNHPDVKMACEVARMLGSKHYVHIPSQSDMARIRIKLWGRPSDLEATGDGVYYACECAAEHFSAVLSGDGADELFGGYQDHIKNPVPATFENRWNRIWYEQIYPLQRVAIETGILVALPYMRPEVVDYAWELPLELKVQGGVGKVVLREVAQGLVPDYVLIRRKRGFCCAFTNC